MPPRGRPKRKQQQQQAEGVENTSSLSKAQEDVLLTAATAASRRNTNRSKRSIPDAAAATTNNNSSRGTSKLEEGEKKEAAKKRKTRSEGNAPKPVETVVAAAAAAVDFADDDVCKLSLVEDTSFVVATAAAVAAHQEFAAAAAAASSDQVLVAEEEEEEVLVDVGVADQLPLSSGIPCHPTGREKDEDEDEEGPPPLHAKIDFYNHSPPSPPPPTTTTTTTTTTTKAFKSKKNTKKSTKTATTSADASVATASSRWNQKWEELKSYYEKHGNIDIPPRLASNQPLATWIHQQREQYKLLQEGSNKPTSMTQERIQKLQQLGFQWAAPNNRKDIPATITTTTTAATTTTTASPTTTTTNNNNNNNNNTKKEQEDAEFQVRLAELVTYKEEHGDLLVPHKYSANMKLGAWVKHQKNQYKLYKEGNQAASQLTPDRVKLLEDVGFIWPLPTKLDKKWTCRLDELKKYKQIHGHCRVPDKFPLNPQLATWVSTQRVQFRLYKEGKKGCMITPARIKALEEIGFDWGREGCSDLVDWEVRYEELRQFHQENGHCRVPRAYKENQQLGNWVHTQRKQYKLWTEGKQTMINEERVAALEKLGFSWSLRPTPDKVDWDFRLAELEEYKKEHGDLLVPRKYQKNPQLGTWVQTQREQYKLLKSGLPSHMTQERIEKLESIGGWVWVARDRVDWDVRLSELQTYKKEHGDCLVPYRYPDNPQLGGWVRTQREQYKLLREGKISHMTQGRIKALEELGFIWSLQEIWKQQEPHLEKTMQLAAKKKQEDSNATSNIISNAAAAIAASNPIISDAATSAAVAAAAAVIQANLADEEEEETKAFAESVVSDGGLLDDVVAFV